MRVNAYEKSQHIWQRVNKQKPEMLPYLGCQLVRVQEVRIEAGDKKNVYFLGLCIYNKWFSLFSAHENADNGEKYQLWGNLAGRLSRPSKIFTYMMHAFFERTQILDTNATSVFAEVHVLHIIKQFSQRFRVAIWIFGASFKIFLNSGFFVK